MHTLAQRFRTLGLSLIGAVLGFSLMLGSWVMPAAADQAGYVTPDGQDITAVVECLPQELSEGDLQRAIKESGKDYLERVFRLKDSYDEYEIAAAEKEFQACLETKGITPEAQKRD